MEEKRLLRKNAALAQTGDADSFENFYILTVADTYQKISGLKVDPEFYEVILTDVYVNLYRNIDSLPSLPEKIEVRMREEILRAAAKRLGDRAVKDAVLEGFDKISDELAAKCWIRIENRTGLRKEREEEEEQGVLPWLLMFARIIAAVVVVGITCGLIWLIWQYVQIF